MAATSLDLSQIKTDALNSASTFRDLVGLGAGDSATFSQAIITGGTVTASTPVLNATQTWNDAAVTFTGMKLDVTDTASASGSLLMDLQVGGTSKFSVDKNSVLKVNKIGEIGANNTSLNQIVFSSQGDWNAITENQGRNVAFGFYDGSPSIRTSSSQVFVGSAPGVFAVDTAFIGFSPTAQFWLADVKLYRDAANTLAQRNGTNAQEYRLYNTYTDASNYERAFLKWDANVFKIGTEAAGTGSGRVLQIRSASNIDIPVSYTYVRITGNGGGVILYDNLKLVIGSGTSDPYFRYDGSVLELGILNSAQWKITDGTNRLFDINTDKSFNIYNTFTDANNYERAFLKWDANTFKIGTEAAGTGTDRAVNFISATKQFTFETIGTWSKNVGLGGDSQGNYLYLHSLGLKLYWNNLYNYTGAIFGPGANHTFMFMPEVLGAAASRDWGHGINSNPTVFVQSATDPNTDNTQWIAFEHNQTDALIYAGSGGISFRTAAAGSATTSGTSEVVRFDTEGMTHTPTWNDAAVTFTGMKLDVTDTASASGSLLMDLQVGGASKFSVDKDGDIIAGRFLDLNSSNVQIRAGGGSRIQFHLGSSVIGALFADEWKIPSTGAFSWANNATNATVGLNLSLYSDAANTLAQRNGTNAQEFRLYNTYTDASNYERGFVKWDSNVLKFGGESAGSGSSTRTVQLTGDRRVYLGSPDTGNGIDIFDYPDNTAMIFAQNGNQLICLRPASFKPCNQAGHQVDLGEVNYNGRWRTAYLGGTTVTSATPMLDLAQTWNDAAVTFSAMKMDVTDTASASGSLLMDLQVGGTSKFKVDKEGHLICGSAALGEWPALSTYAYFMHKDLTPVTDYALLQDSSGNTGINCKAGQSINFQDGGSNVAMTLKSDKLGIGTSSPDGKLHVKTFTATHTGLILETTDGNTNFPILDCQYSGAKVFKVDASSDVSLYNTYTDASNYERAFLKWDANVFKIGTEAAGTGTARNVEIVSPSVKFTGTGNYEGLKIERANPALYLHDTNSTSGKRSWVMQYGGNKFFMQPTNDSYSGWGILFELNHPGSGSYTASSGSETVMKLSPTVNQSGTAGYEAFVIDVTETAIGSGSHYLMDLQVGGVSKFSVDNGGDVVSDGKGDFNDAVYFGEGLDQTVYGNRGWYFKTTNAGAFAYLSDYNGGWIQRYQSGNTKFTGGFASGNKGAIDIDVNGNGDGDRRIALTDYPSGVALLRLDFNTNRLDQRNSTNPQTYNIYNTYTDASNYERGFVKWDANVFKIGTEAAGTGSARNIEIVGGDIAVPGTSEIQFGGASYRLRIDGAGRSIDTDNSQTLALQDGISFSGAYACISLANSTFTDTDGDQIGVSITPTYNQTGTAGSTDLLINRTETALGSGSHHLMDLQVGGVSKFKIDKNSHVTIGDGIISSSLRFGSSIRSFSNNANGINVTSYGSVTAFFGSGTVSVKNLVFHTNPASRGAESAIFLDNAQELSQRNGTNAQSYLIYNTYTDASNYERGFVKWDSLGFEIGTESAGTGAAKNIAIMRNGTQIATFASSGLIMGNGVGGPRLGLSGVSATTPTLLPNSQDSNSGIGQNADDQLSLIAGGLEGLRLTETAGVITADIYGDTTINGTFSATTKSFLIDHPSKPGMKLRYGSLEGPENGVYVRGTTIYEKIILPDYWKDLIDEKTITVTLTPIHEFQPLFVKNKNCCEIEVGGCSGEYDYVVYGERKDVAKLEVEHWA